MLDSNISTQLKVFSTLDRTIELVYAQSAHSKQQELEAMLTDVASVSSHISFDKVKPKVHIQDLKFS
ncbi:MAG: hypothetical protein R3A45_01470 [Bdellovibrionota bacterium]